MWIARNAIEDECVLVRAKTAGLRGGFDRLPPQLNGRLVRHEFAAAGVINEDPADFTVDRQVPEHITAGAVKEVGNVAEDFSLRAFARAWRAEEKYGAIFHVNLFRISNSERTLSNCNSKLRAVLVFQLDFLHFTKWNHHFLAYFTFADLDIHV